MSDESEELAKYKRAVQIAREKGEHYPVCNMPPPDIRVLKATDLRRIAWREANRGKCDCWKSRMEEALK